MQALFDVFGFVSVLLHGLDLVAQTVVVGSVLFAAFGVPRQLARAAVETVEHATRRAIVLAAAATVATSLASAALNATILATSIDATFADIVGARFAVVAIVKAIAAAAVAAIAATRPLEHSGTRGLLLALSALVVSCATADSHAAARLDGVQALYAATFAHQVGAALWLGGLPAFRAALAHASATDGAAIARRYSMLAIAGVALIILGAVAFAIDYVGSPAGAYGTAYGAMAITKTAFLLLLLLLGATNFSGARSASRDPAAIARVARIVTVEIGVGAAVLMAAASITSAPPAVDLGDDRVTLAEIAQRWAPSPPRLESPSHDMLGVPAVQARLDAERRAREASPHAAAFVPGERPPEARNASDVAWSEYNHHWSGVVVLAIGVAALLARSGHASWARHWPLLFVGIALLIVVRGDPEVWPMGTVGFLEAMKDPEVMQHRLFALLLVGFAVFEWRVQTDRARATAASRVFPLLVAVAATLLLTHSHALGNVKEELLIETTHLPIAVLGVVAGWSRWVEVQAPRTGEGRAASWLWPACFVLIGLLLLDYREA